MEMVRFYKIQVWTLDSAAPPIEVHISGEVDGSSVLASTVLDATCKQLGIHRDNWKYFCLSEKRWRPIRRWKSEDHIPYPCAELCLQKWVFQPELERHLLEDEASLRLLYLEASVGIESGKLQPSVEQKQKLEEYVDPSFPLLNQYVLLCHKMSDYWTVRVEDCRACACRRDRKQVISCDKIMDLHIRREGLELREGEARGYVCWNKISSWTTCKENEVEFHIDSHGNESCLCLRSDRVNFILSALSEILKTIQTDESFFYTSMIERDRDEMSTTYQNAFFDPSSPIDKFEAYYHGLGFKDNVVNLSKDTWQNTHIK